MHTDIYAYVHIFPKIPYLRWHLSLVLFGFGPCLCLCLLELVILQFSLCILPVNFIALVLVSIINLPLGKTQSAISTHFIQEDEIRFCYVRSFTYEVLRIYITS